MAHTRKKRSSASPKGVAVAAHDSVGVAATSEPEPDTAGRVDAKADEIQLVTFMLDDSEIGVPVTLVKEIIRAPYVTRIPKVAAYIEGVANLRGSILPIVNLRRKLDLPDGPRTDDNRVVVVEVGGQIRGWVVDRMSEVIRVSRTSIEPPPVVTASPVTSFLNGVVKLEGGDRLVLLLDVEKMAPNGLAEPVAADVVQNGARSRVETRVYGQTPDDEQVVSFHVADEEYAISIADVQEIIRVPEISRVPQAPTFVAGMVALRNTLVPIVNLRHAFQMPSIEPDEDSRIVVVNLDNVVTGIQVDAVSEVLTVSKDAIDAPPAIMRGSDAVPLLGVAKLENGKRLIVLLDIRRILSPAEPGQVDASDGGMERLAANASSERGRRQGSDEEQFVSFRLAQEQFGVSIHQVQEIIWLADVTRVPRMPEFVNGIINLRGSVLPIIDMRKRFGIAAVNPTDSTSIVVVDVDGRKTGIVVDSVSEVLRLRRDAIEPTSCVAGLDASFVDGVGKLPNDQGMLIILNLRKVLSLADLRIRA